MIVLDTDHVSLVSRPDSAPGGRVLARIASASPIDTVTTVITYEEQIRGWTALLASARTGAERVDRYDRLKATLTFFCNVRVLPFDSAAAAEFDRLRSLKLRLGTMDMKIAAVTLANGATLLSRNLRDFRLVPGLAVEDWSA